MYIESVGLRAQPFHTKGQPTEFVQYRSQQEAIEFLDKILTDDRGIGLLHGPAASGKSVLINYFVQGLPTDLSIAIVDGARLKTTQLLSQILSQFGYEVKLNTADELLNMLNVFVVQQARTRQPPLLVLKNINAMYPSALCALCKLATLTVHNRFALRIVLVGSHDFRRIIYSASMKSVAQRMIGDFELKPMTAKETLVYLYTKLRSCGVDRPDDIFSFDTCDRLYLASGGWPGKLDSIAMSIIDRPDDLAVQLHGIVHQDLKLGDELPRLVVTRDGKMSQELELVTTRTLLGSSDLCDIIIDDRFISKHHALMIREQDSVILVDLRSMNGTFVNSRRIKRQVLRNNDIISMGNHRIKMFYANSPAPAEIDDPDLADTARMRNIANALRAQKGDTEIVTPSRVLRQS